MQHHIEVEAAVLAGVVHPDVQVELLLPQDYAVGDLEVDKRAAALWSLCPTLELPTGVDSVVCDQSSCVQVCQTGMRSIGNRKTRCRWNRKRGFFWTKVRNYDVIIGSF